MVTICGAGCGVCEGVDDALWRILDEARSGGASVDDMVMCLIVD